MRYFLIFFIGVAIGSLATVFFQTNSNFSPVSRSTTATQNKIVLETPAAVTISQTSKKEDEVSVPTVVNKEEGITPVVVSEIKVVAPVAEPLPLLNFTSINERPVFWPAAVRLLADTVVPLMEKNKKIADIPLSEGATLQLSKVFGDGKLEVRAKNMKFEIDYQLTNFDEAIRIRIKELEAQGNKTVAPYFRSGEVYTPPKKPLPTMPVKAPPISPSKSDPVITKAPSKVDPVDTPDEVIEVMPERKTPSLDDKMNALFYSGGAPADKNKSNKK